MTSNRHVAYVGLGSNLGNPAESIMAAITALGLLPSTVLTKKSSLYKTEPINADGDDYVNAVIELRTLLAPAELLLALHKVEQQFGRTRTYQNAPRTLDCDLLLYEQQVIDTPDLQIPHPRMHQRAFVLIPLLEIVLDIHIPQLGYASSLLTALHDQPIQKLV